MYLQTKYRWKNFSRSDIEKYQQKKLEKHLKNIPTTNFYRNWLQSGTEMEDWQAMPYINKAIFMKNFDELVTVKLKKEEALAFAKQQEEERYFTNKKKGLTVGLSSGTSGNQGIFLTTTKEEDQWLGNILAKMLPGGIFQAHRVAFFLRANSNLYEGIGSGKITFHFYDLWNDLTDNLAHLLQYQADILVAPPSMLLKVIDYYKQMDEKLPFEKIISVAEVLEPEDRAYLEQETGQIIHQIYQCTEGFLGCTCQYGTLHLNEDVVIIEKEYLDSQQKYFSPVITDFMRSTQPIIKYQLNDILVEAEQPCPCGSSYLAISQIIGRCDDIFVFTSKTGAEITIFPDFIRRAILSADASIKEYEVIQHVDRSLDIAMPNQSLYLKAKANLHQLLVDKNIVIPDVRYVEYVPLEKGVKRRKIKRLS